MREDRRLNRGADSSADASFYSGWGTNDLYLTIDTHQIVLGIDRRLQRQFSNGYYVIRTANFEIWSSSAVTVRLKLSAGLCRH